MVSHTSDYLGFISASHLARIGMCLAGYITIIFSATVQIELRGAKTRTCPGEVKCCNSVNLSGIRKSAS